MNIFSLERQEATQTPYNSVSSSLVLKDTNTWASETRVASLWLHMCTCTVISEKIVKSIVALSWDHHTYHQCGK